MLVRSAFVGVLLVMMRGASLQAQAGRTYRVVPRDSLAPRADPGFAYTTGSDLKNGIRRFRYYIVDSVYAGTSAAAAGLRRKDEVISINGFDIATEHDSARFKPGIPTPVRVRRGDQILELVITAKLVPPF